MQEIDRALEEAIHNLFCGTNLDTIILEKLEAAGITDPSTVRKLLEAIRDTDAKTLSVEIDGPDQNINISFNEQDFQKIENLQDPARNEQFSQFAHCILDKITDDILTEVMGAKWQAEKAQQKIDIKGFRERLEERWGIPLDLLRMLLTIGREWLSDTHKAVVRTKRKSNAPSHEVVIRLCARACQVMDEIICLLENGFADGAMARWRTLHEINVALTLVMKFGDEIAGRYSDFQTIETEKARKKYQQCYERLGFAAISKKTTNAMIKKYDDVIKRHGKDFKDEYGWAAPFLNIRKGEKITFYHLEREVGLDDMRTYYNFASSNVHAGPHGAFYRLGLMGEKDSLLAGRSNASLTEPGQNAAVTFTQICVLACGEIKDIDYLLFGKAMLKLRNMIPSALVKADKKLKRDDKKLRSMKKSK